MFGFFENQSLNLSFIIFVGEICSRACLNAIVIGIRLYYILRLSNTYAECFFESGTVQYLFEYDSLM